MTSFLPLSIEILLAITVVGGLELLVIRIVACSFLFSLPLWCLVLTGLRISLTFDAFDIKIDGISCRSRFNWGFIVIVAKVL